MSEPFDRGLDGRFDADGLHILDLRVYYEDTDAGGIVYHANYLRFMERGRSAMLRCLGYRHTELAAESGVAFAVRRATIDFVTPARLEDALEVTTRIADIRGASFAVAQSVRRDGRPLAGGELMLALIGRDGRPTRTPPALRAALQTLYQRQKRD